MTPPDAFARRRTTLSWAAACLGALAGGAAAQEAGNAPSSSLTPTLGVSGSYVETRSRSNGANGREFVATLIPGVSYVTRSGRVQGSLEYQSLLNERRGLAETAGFDAQNLLSAAFVAELVPTHVFLDARAGITQQQISAFGEQAAEGPTLGTRNRTEVRAVTLAPRAQGSLGGFANYQLGASATASRSTESEGADSDSSGGSVLLRSPQARALLGWQLEGSQDRTRYAGQEAVENRRAVASLTSSPTVELRLALRGGRESVAQGALAQSYQSNTYGAGLQWLPGPRTTLSIDADERYFGHSGRVALQHRMPRSILTYSFSRDTNEGSAQSVAGVTLYDQLFAQAASAFPDPAQRDAAVRDLLASTGQDGNQVVSPGFQTSSVSVQRRQDLSLVWLGARTTINAQGYTNAQSQITFRSDIEPLIGEPVRQHGYSGSLSYRLTPLSSVLLGGSRRMTFATSTLQGNDLKSAYASLTQRLGPRTNATIGARYSVFNSATDPYRETSVTASLNLRF